MIEAALMVLLQMPPGPAHPAAPDIGSQARAEVNELNRRLLASSSATETLRRWCADRRLAAPAAIRAIRVGGRDAAPSPRVLGLLRVRSASQVRYRRVQLVCGAHVLSRAENWYVPGRLSVEMNRRLETTQAPFGAVVSPLGFHRRTLEADILSPGSPDVVLRHVAVLTTGAGTPFSLVVENYTREAVAAPPPVTAPGR